MAEEDTNQNLEETPEAAHEAAVPEAPADAPEAPADAPAAQARPAAAKSAPAEVLAPKERRRRARAAKAAKVPARATATPEERNEQRLAERRKKAQVRSAGRVRSRTKERANKTPTEAIAAREHTPGVQKVRQGVVVSDRADKTITVRIDTARRHRRYSKVVRTSNTLHAHDESNDAHIGDTVIVREARPLSRTKRWRLVEVAERAK
jgi:small subunit ribosomal protein S17